ncbi:MAG: calcium/sodium antiporter [Gemmatimonadota bacterium]|nr:MAG: calcium/sodium antiporter [Gemmatimonadota bacterium]
MAYIQLFGGLIYLLMGGDLLVRGAVALARRVRVPPFVIAVSVVAFGTSLPELVVTVQAVLEGYLGIAIGNVVGSNIANVLLVIGTPIIVYPLACTERSARRDSVVMLGVSVFFVVLCFVGDLDRLAGLVLLAGLAALLGYTVRETARTQRDVDRSTPMEWVLGLPSRARMIALFIVAGVVGLPLGAGMFVEAAADVAGQLGVSDTVVGLTIVAVGTSLPELATAHVAAIRRQTEVAVGTVIGSCVFNILGIMGVAAVASPSPIPVPSGFLSLDLPVMLGAAFALTILVWRRRPTGRAAGILLVAGYGAYLVALLSSA